MIRNQSRSSKRSAFTLVELMVVILIIAILVSLVSSAVLKALGKIPEVQTRTEIAQMSVALQAFMSAYNVPDPPPSTLVLNETAPLTSPNAAYLTRVFGRNLGAITPSNPTGGVDWNGDGTTSGIWTLQGQNCLTFFLGGIPNTAAVASGLPPAPQGFSTNNMNPGQAGGKRNGPYFTFVTSRLVPVVAIGGFYYYQDPWQVKVSTNGIGPMPYVYFSSYGINNGYSITDCASVTSVAGTSALPYWTAGTGASGSTTFTYSNTFQIISAGKNGVFGGGLWIPASGAVGAGADDQANFSGSLLGAGQS